MVRICIFYITLKAHYCIRDFPFKMFSRGVILFSKGNLLKMIIFNKRQMSNVRWKIWANFIYSCGPGGKIIDKFLE